MNNEKCYIEFQRAIDHIVHGKPDAAIAAVSVKSQDGFNVHMHIDGDHTEIIFVLANVIWRMHEFTGLEASEICDQLKAAVGTLDRYKDFFQRS